MAAKGSTIQGTMRRWRKVIEKRLRELESPSSEVRVTALRTLGFHPFAGPKAQPAPAQVDRVFTVIARLMCGDPDLEVRCTATQVLANWYERRAAKILMERLADASETPRVHGFAAEGLGNILAGRPAHGPWRDVHAQAIRVLLDALTAPDAEARFWSLFALGQLRVTEARPRVEVMAATDHAQCPNLWRVSDEAADVLAYGNSGTWPEREPVGSPT